MGTSHYYDDNDDDDDDDDEYDHFQHMQCEKIYIYLDLLQLGSYVSLIGLPTAMEMAI